MKNKQKPHRTFASWMRFLGLFNYRQAYLCCDTQMRGQALGIDKEQVQCYNVITRFRKQPFGYHLQNPFEARSVLKYLLLR